MKVTRKFKVTPTKEALDSLKSMCELLAPLRKEVWHRYGGLRTIGTVKHLLAKEFRATDFYKSIPVSGQVKADTVTNILDDIIMYREASKYKVRKDITKRTSDNEERKHLFTLLKSDKWQSDNFLSGRMRKHFKHGKPNIFNQVMFDVRAVKVTPDLITLNGVGKFHGLIELPIKHNYVLSNFMEGKNVRVMLKDKYIELHFSLDKPEGRPCDDKEIGIDKGYTEAFVDSEGEFYVKDFGKLTTAFSDKNKEKGKARNKLHSLEKKYREQGKLSKANNLKRFNLGHNHRIKRKERIENQLKDRVYKSVHRLCDKSKLIVSEDLTSLTKNRTKFKNMNRRLANWYKGILTQAVEEITTQRGCKHLQVNPAYTSQMDSRSGFLEGRRAGDKFYHAEHEVVSQADYNASRNILARKDDKEITLYMPYREVKRILLARVKKRDANTHILDFSCSGIFPLSTKNELTNSPNHFCGFGGIS